MNEVQKPPSAQGHFPPSLHLQHSGQSSPRCCLSLRYLHMQQTWKEETGASSPEAGYFWCRGISIPLSVGDNNEIQFAGQHVLRPERCSRLDTETKMFTMSGIMLCGVRNMSPACKGYGRPKAAGGPSKAQLNPQLIPSCLPASICCRWEQEPQTKMQGPRVNQDNLPPDKQLGKAFWKTKPQGGWSTSHLRSDSTFHQSAPGQHRQCWEIQKSLCTPK